MKTTITFLSGAALLALSSCKNPADETTDAEVSEAVEVAATAGEGAQKYVFASESTIGFVGSKVTGSHEGGFKAFEGFFTVEDGTPVGGEFTIDMDSTWSDADGLTKHLKNADFFNVETYPESKFVVTGFNKKSDSDYEVSGNLTLHGETKNITFPTKVATSEEAVSLTAEFDINRKDWGIVFKGKPDDLIRDEVVIRFDLKATPES